jgi:hypothetical protein
VRFGYAKRVSHLVDVDVDEPENSMHPALCGASVRLGPPEEQRLGQVADCPMCWERFSNRTSNFSQAETVMEATVDAGGEPVGPDQVEGPNSL